MTNRPVFDINTTTYSLSIQLSLNGFSFSIATAEGKIVTDFHKNNSEGNYSEQELYDEVIKTFNSKPELQAKFNTVEVIYHNKRFALVPHKLFDPNNKKSYLKYSVKTLATDYISHDDIKETDIVSVFIPYININNFLIDQLGEFNYQHSSSLLVSHVIKLEKNNQAEKVYLHFSDNLFEVIITKGNTLLLFNTFSFITNEDVLYYVLFCMEQLSLSPDKIELTLLSTVENDLYDLLYTYVRNIQKATTDNNLLLHQLALNL